MKNILITTLAICALASCTSQPEHRNPSGLSEGVSNSSQAVADASGNVVQATVNFSGSALEKSGKSADTLWNVVKGSGNAVSNVSVVGWDFSKGASTFIVTSAGNSSDAAVDGSKWVVTTSGNIFEGAWNASKTGVRVSANLLEGSSTVIVKLGKGVLGTLQWSADGVSDVATWTSRQSTNGSEWVVDKAGKLWDSSGRVVGQVVDASGTAVGFVADQSGNILTISKNASVAVYHATSNSASSLADKIGHGFGVSGRVVGATLTASADGVVHILKWGSGQSANSVRIIANSSANLFHSEAVARPRY